MPEQRRQARPDSGDAAASCVLPGSPAAETGELRAVIIDADGPVGAPAVLAAVDAAGPAHAVLLIDPRSAVPALPPTHRVTEPVRLTRLITFADTRVPAVLCARSGSGNPINKRPGKAAGWPAGGDFLPEPVARYTRRTLGPFDLVANRSWRYHGGEVWEISADGIRYIVKRHRDTRHWRQETAGYGWAAALPAGHAPRLISTDEDLTVIITTLLPGDTLTWTALGPAEQGEACRQAGALLRALHQTAPSARTPASARLLSKAQAALDSTRPMLTTIETAVITNQLAQLKRLATRLPVAATHGDFQPRNLLWDPAARVLGVIDFEKAVAAPATRDIASITAAMPAGRDDLLAAFYDGLGRELVGDELAATTAFTVLTALTEYAWGEENGDYAAMSAAREAIARQITEDRTPLLPIRPSPARRHHDDQRERRASARMA